MMTAVPKSTIAPQSWVPFLVGDQPAGEVHWLRVEERPHGTLATGIWRIGPEEGACLPYAVQGSETIQVLEGEAELDVPGGEVIRLGPGDIISLPDGFTATWRTLSPFKKFFVVA